MSYAERCLGGKQIVGRLEEIFASAGKSKFTFEWFPEMSEKFSCADQQTLKIFVDDKAYEIRDIPREVLEDYPGCAGNEVIDQCISKILSLKTIDFARLSHLNEQMKSIS